MPSICCKKYGGALAFKEEILRSTARRQGGAFVWVLRQKGEKGDGKSSPISGAGKNKRTLTDLVQHEITYSERHTPAVLG